MSMLQHYLTLVLNYSFEVVNEVTKGYPIFQTEVLDPYSHLNGGQQLGSARGLSVSTDTYIFSLCNLMSMPTGLWSMAARRWQGQSSSGCPGKSDSISPVCKTEAAGRRNEGNNKNGLKQVSRLGINFNCLTKNKAAVSLGKGYCCRDQEGVWDWW